MISCQVNGDQEVNVSPALDPLWEEKGMKQPPSIIMFGSLIMKWAMVWLMGRFILPQGREQRNEQSVQFHKTVFVPISLWALDVVKNKGFHPESLSQFKMMRQLLPGISIPKEYISDFLTIICYPQVQHLPFRRMPVKGVGNKWARGAFIDSPHNMSCSSRLKLCSNIPAQHYITSFPKECLLHHQEGTVLLGANGELVRARCSSLQHLQADGNVGLSFDEV